MKNKELKFETLKKSYKKQIIIGSIFICVIGSIFTFATTKAKYKLTQDIKLVTGTVNYKVPDMRIVAVNVSEDGENYEIQNEVPASGYTLNTDRSVCKVATEESGIENAPVDTNITINYHDGVIGFDNISKRNTRCYLYFDKIIKPPEPTSEDTLTKLNITNINETTPDFSKTATTNEGIFKAEDGMYGGTSYYWRGAVTNNYVRFANFCWRIIRINGDGSIRLIYDGSSCHANGSNSDSIVKTSVAYNSQYNNASYVGWTYTTSVQRPTPSTGGTASNAKTQLESWYKSTITGTNASKVADGKYCNDRTVGSGTWSAASSGFNHATYQRATSIYQPTLSCDVSDVYILKVGLITADEVMYAGGKYDINNSSYYLYNGQSYWTMSPSYWNSGHARVCFVHFVGYLHVDGIVDYTDPGLRPVINLRSDISISSGDGSQSNPYVVQ